MIDHRLENRKGIVFHIIHGSFVDGHGIRTTVFLKGCPLRCVWCCNPEGQEKLPEIKLTSSKCNGCGQCVIICPVQAIALNRELGDDNIHINRNLCTNCGKCVGVCFTGALEYFGKYMTVDEVFNVISRDKQYYKNSGGGVTIGGGEPTLQPAFTYELLKKCQEHNIHTALDTCGYVSNDKGIKILEQADLLLFDLKGMDIKEHLLNTGVYNALILKNLKKLAAMGKSIIVRMPIIPGYNNSEQNIKQAAELLSKMKSVERVDILPYHKYGTVKYEQLGKTYKLNVQTPSQEYIDRIKNVFERYGIQTQIGG